MKEGGISLKYRIKSDGTVGVHAAGTLASDEDIRELGSVSHKLKDCGARLVYLDLVDCSIIDTRVITPIIRLHRELTCSGCDFEVRVSDNRLFSFLQEVELHKIVKIEYLPNESACLASSEPSIAS